MSASSGGDAAPLPERLHVDWEGEHRFRGGREGYPWVVIDGKKGSGPGAVDTLVLSLVACSSIDVVDILEKRRTPAESLSVEVAYARVQNATPRRLEAVHLVFRVRTASDAHHVERAVALSLEKYCSVASSLRDDVRITYEAQVEAP